MQSPTTTCDSSTRPRWHRIRLWLLLTAMSVVASMWWIRTHDPRTLGRSDALAAIQRGELVMLWPSGLTFHSPERSGDVARVLRDKYKIARRMADDAEYVHAHNEVMTEEIERRYGMDVWSHAAEEAARTWQLEQMASGKSVPPN